MESSVTEFVSHFDEFADNTTDARKKSARDRDYVDHKQLTSTEVSTLQARKQPPLVFNRIQPKVMFMLGTERQTRTDPKAYPRTPKHEDSAEAITDALRYVADNNNFDDISSLVFEHEIIEGTGGAIFEYNKDREEVDINFIDWDRLYWDVHSRRHDFSDSTRKGIVIWMDLSEGARRWPDKKNDLEMMVQAETEHPLYNDKPDHIRWIDTKRQRIMVMQEYYLEGGKWYEVFFCKGFFLQEPKVSPYLDGDGLPSCPIEIQSSFVDRDGSRYGVVRGYIDPQDEINKRRSKALHILNTNQTIGESGAVADVNKAKREKSKPEGHIELNPGMMERFKFVDQSPELAAHLQFMQEAKTEIDAIGANSAMAGKDQRSQSGRALQARQQGGYIELGVVYDRHRMWKRRAYRQIWARVKQFWTEEKWIRVTDDEANLKFVGLNQKVTVGQLMQEHAEETGQQMPPEFAQDPRMSQVAEIRNPVPELDVDIILEEAPDVVTLQQETFEAVMNGIQSTGQSIPLEIMLDLMPNVPNKRQILDKLAGDPAQQQATAQQQQEAAQIAKAKEVSEIEATQAKAAKDNADAQETEIDTMIKMHQPVM